MKTYKVELDPNNKQITKFLEYCKVSRFVFNWGLQEWERRYDAEPKEKTGGMRLTTAFNAIKYDQFNWVTKYPYCLTESAFRNLDNAFGNYFRQKKDGTVLQRISKLKASGKWEQRLAKMYSKGRKGHKCDPGYPRFKSRNDKNKFQMRGLKVSEKSVRITGIGWVKLKQYGYIPVDAPKYGVYASISENAKRWYLSVFVYDGTEQENIEERDIENVIGIDLGISHALVCSDGSFYDAPDQKQLEEKKTRLQRELSRRAKGGENWIKTKDKLAKVCKKIVDTRETFLHQATTDIIKKNPDCIVLEDLNVSGMLKNHHLAKALSNASLATMKTMLEYKAKSAGIKVVYADRFYPSSKTCSNCGKVKTDLSLSDRIYKCECGIVIDRDLNAAINLAALVEGRNSSGLPVELG